MLSCPFFSSSTSEERWVGHTTRNYTIDLDTLPCIFQVPQKFRNENPEAYTPQVVGLGPYHHLRPELHDMESQKRASVRSFLGHTYTENFSNFIHEEALKELGPEGRRNSLSTSLSYYDTYLDLGSKILSWILVIDGIFLRQFLQDESKWDDRRMVADVMMLENQIPLVMLEDIRGILQNSFQHLQNSFPDAEDLSLLDPFKSFCEKLSPLKLCQTSEDTAGAFHHAKHLLHFLYVLIVENFTTKEPSPPKSGPINFTVDGDRRSIIGKAKQWACRFAKEVVSAIDQARAQGLKIPGLCNNVSTLLEQLQKTSDFNDNSDKSLQHELAHKIDVPSASQLHHIANIKFSCTDGGIRYILFDDKKNVLYLPEITLTGTSEVVLRNLVAYEAASEPAGSVLELAEYVDLMCGIIKAENDVKLLKAFGIIKGNLADDEIARIFNGINKTTQIPPEPTEIQTNVQRMLKVLQKILYPLRKKNPLTNKIIVGIPSATSLQDENGAEFTFKCTGHGKKDILFDEKIRELCLPEINLGKNPEETLNAYEAEYVDFMCAIIHTVDDVEFLKREDIGIIKGDEKIFDAFNRIRRPVEWPNELSLVQKTVHKLNKKFGSIRIVKAYKFMERSFAAFQRWIHRIFPTLVLILLALQTFCETFGCRARRSGYAAVPGGSSFGLDNSEAKLMMPRKVLRYDPNLI